ncbi:unnamed protein product [Phyllotreta striolata]|uniref:VWFA domain-containing protein n=1 Tax=Phyllotreta striolata TaxID=444603 RepID=A0A9N9TFW2_PHYSR|nr:unnamed protein product [Phyllotreta striolata]
MKCLLKILLIVLFSIIIRHVETQTSSAIPEIIQDCYKSDFKITARPPLTLHLLIELLRKIEIDERNAISARLLATSIIHGVLFNGIRRTRNTQRENEDFIPFRALGDEFYNYKLLADYLIPGQIDLFPRNSLSLSELCFLHTIISSTVDPFERGDESLTCNDRSSMPLEMGDFGALSRCPLAKGVIKTKWGPIAATHLISGIAAGLQDNSVTFGRALRAIQNGNHNSVDASAIGNNEANIVWVATMAGDLARAILNQTTGSPLIGNKGFWNDTLLPRAYYLKTSTWDMTEADILAGIDGAILGTHIKGWMGILESTRISQVLDMYYSERGITYQFDYRANNRSSSFESLLSAINLEDQIIGSAKLLQTIGRFKVSPSDEAIKEFAKMLSGQFETVAEKLTKMYDGIEYLNGKQMRASLEVIIILDDSFDYYKALQMIYLLSEAIQVSYYASKVGIINGQSGNWMVNVTGEVFQIFTDLNEPNDKWPGFLSLADSLETLMDYYQDKTNNDCAGRQLKPEGQVILVFSKDGRLTDDDVTRSRLFIRSLKTTYPATRMIYVTQTGEHSLQQLLQDGDSTMRSSSDVVSLVEQVADRLSRIPANLIKFYCNDTVVFEDFITPQLESVYEINKEYIRRGVVNAEFKNSDYGDLVVCAYKSNTTNDRVCKGITVNSDISFNSGDFCAPDSPSDDVHFTVTANSSRIRCTEFKCRYPDQVRLTIKYTFTSTGSRVLSKLLLIITNIFLLLIVNEN